MTTTSIFRSQNETDRVFHWRISCLLLILSIGCWGACLDIAFAEPPSQPPWLHKLSEAQRQAIERSVPLLICFTKESPKFYQEELDLLFSNPSLKESFEKFSWLLVKQTYSDYGKDNETNRTWIRFGVTGYPTILVVNPTSLAILRSVGRTPNEFISDVNDIEELTIDSVDEPILRLREAEKRARSLQSQGTLSAAQKALDDEDIVVRTIALRILSKKDPKIVLKNARELIQTPNDPFRFELCTLLSRFGSSDVTEELEFLFQHPDNSLNPNLLRVSVASALGICGNEESIQVLAPIAANGDYRNVLTATCVDGIGRIAKRLPPVRSEAVKILLTAFPQPTEDRLCKQLAIQVHQSLVIITGLNVPMPESYNEQSRDLMIEGFKRYSPE
jgi:hypothetical protein